jgi:hypothetical protein
MMVKSFEENMWCTSYARMKLLIPNEIAAVLCCLKSTGVTQQHGALEKHQVICVVACLQDGMHSGYHPTIEPALKLSDGKSRFQLRLLDSSGIILRESVESLSVDQLQPWLNR